MAGLPGDLLDEMHKRAAAKLFLFKSDAGGYYLATRARSMWSTANPWLRKELKKATSVHWVSVSASGDWIIISDQRFVASVDVAPALTRQLAQFYSAARAEGAAAAAAYDAAMARFQPWLASYVGMKAAAQVRCRQRGAKQESTPAALPSASCFQVAGRQLGGMLANVSLTAPPLPTAAHPNNRHPNAHLQQPLNYIK